MDFSNALLAIKDGALVEREGWGCKGMVLFQVSRPPLLGIFPEGTEVDYRPHIDMKTAGGWIVPWLPSQTDIMANDWQVKEE